MWEKRKGTYTLQTNYSIFIWIRAVPMEVSTVQIPREIDVY
jgi:hypothetical protein